MFSMRIKLSTVRNKEWRCCACLHVRTATIIFGIWHLLLHIMSLVILVLFMRNRSYNTQYANFEENDFLPTPLSKVKDDDNPYYLPTTQEGKPIAPNDIEMGAIMTICTLSITLLMVYGAIKGKPKQILPFFFLQLFDFAITTLTATGYFCYLRSVHQLVAEHWYNLPLRQEILSLSPQNLSLLVLFFFLISMVWKAYWIGVVWRCHKYLALKQQATQNTIHYILPNVESDRNEPAYGSLLEGWGDFSLFTPLKQTPPPSYQDIMDEQPPPYPSTASVTATIEQEVRAPRFTNSSENESQEGTHADDNAQAASTPVVEKPESENSVSPIADIPDNADINAASTSGINTAPSASSDNESSTKVTANDEKNEERNSTSTGDETNVKF